MGITDVLKKNAHNQNEQTLRTALQALKQQRERLKLSEST